MERQNSSNGLAGRRAEEPNKQNSRRLNISRIWEEKKTCTDWVKFFWAVDVCDVITQFKFGGDRLRGLGSAEGQILPFPIDFDGRPYNTLTPPCD